MKTNYTIRNGESLNLEIDNDIEYRQGDRTYQYPSHIPTGLSRSSRQNRLLRLSARGGVQECPLPKRLASQKVTQIHLDTIRRQLAYRLQVAKASHQNSLVSLLEREFQQLDCRANASVQ